MRFYLLSDAHDGPDLLLTIAGILVGGLVCQAIARRLRLPAIVPLLVVGIVVGKPILGWLNPAVLGAGYSALIGFAVAIILFEGGLSLKPESFRLAGRPIRRLCGGGALLTWGLSTAIAFFLFPSLGAGPATLFGALVIVTGPTVIMPLLNVIKARPRVSEVLRGEAILIDPIGALLAVLTHEFIIASREGGAGDVVVALLTRLGVGALLGAGGALLLDFLLRRQDQMAPELKNRTTLIVAVALYAVSERFIAESGVLTATLAGLILGWRHPPGIDEVEEFKSHVVGVLVSMIFILLAADLDLEAVQGLGVNGIVLVVLMILLVRPVSAFLALLKTDLTTREKLFISWIAPRGIVAAAVSSLFALQLQSHGFVEAGQTVKALTFAVIAGTVLIQGPTARWVGGRLGVLESEPTGILVLGGNLVGRTIAQALHRNGHRVLVVDRNYGSVRRTREAGVPARRADALDEATIENLDLDGIGSLMAMTSADSVNRLAVRLYEREFGRDRVRALQTRYSPTREAAPNLPPWLFGDRLHFEDLMRRFESGAGVEIAEIDHETTVDEVIATMDGRTPLLVTGADGMPRFLEEHANLAVGETLFFVDGPED